MTALQSDLDFLAHFGVKGMKWGVRNKREERNAHGLSTGPSGSERREARKELRSTIKTEKQILKQSRKARTPEEAKIASDRYKREIIKKVNSPEYAKAVQDGNTMGRGEMLAHVAVYNVWSPLTIRSAKQQYADTRENGVKNVKAGTKEMLKELQK